MNNYFNCIINYQKTIIIKRNNRWKIYPQLEQTYTRKKILDFRNLPTWTYDKISVDSLWFHCEIHPRSLADLEGVWKSRVRSEISMAILLLNSTRRFVLLLQCKYNRCNVDQDLVIVEELWQNFEIFKIFEIFVSFVWWIILDWN